MDACWPLPDCDQIVGMMSQARIYSAIDLKAGFHNIPIEPSAVTWFGIITQDGVWHWNRMPFGAKGAPAHFQKLVQITISKTGDGRVAVYIDDIIVFGDDVEEVW